MSKTENKNIMGSRVETGFQCKPVKEDSDVTRPIMPYRFHLFFCDGLRCQKMPTKFSAEDLRMLLKEMNLHQGQNRIKVTRNNCFGACRFKRTALIYSFAGEMSPLWLKQTHRWNKTRWKNLFSGLAKNPQMVVKKFSSSLIPIEKNEFPPA